MGAVSLITTTAMIKNPTARALMLKSPVPLTIQYAMIYAGLSVMIVSGIAMLKGCNWARYLYVFWVGLALVVGIAVSPMKAALIPQIVVFAVVVFFLFRPKASEYFLSKRSSYDTQSI